MGSIERRIEALERSLGTKSHEEAPEERKRLIEELKARWREAEEKMAQEEAEGNFARRRALENLQEAIKRRARAREDGF